MWVPPQSKFHHLERKKKRGSNGPFSRAMLVYQRVPIRNGNFPIAMVVSPLLKAALTRRHHWVSGRSPTSPPRLLWAPAHPCPRGRRRPILARIRDSAPGGKPRNHGNLTMALPPHNFRRLWCLVNGNSRILKWRYASTIFLAIFCCDILLHRPKE